MNRIESISVPAHTAAALVMACVAVEDILIAGKLTEEIAEELEAIKPELESFVNMA